MQSRLASRLGRRVALARAESCRAATSETARRHKRPQRLSGFAPPGNSRASRSWPTGLARRCATVTRPRRGPSAASAPVPTRSCPSAASSERADAADALAFPGGPHLRVESVLGAQGRLPRRVQARRRPCVRTPAGPTRRAVPTPVELFEVLARSNLAIAGAEHHSVTGVRTGAPLAFSSTTTNLAGSVLLALRPTT